jgi:hypothetical protein
MENKPVNEHNARNIKNLAEATRTIAGRLVNTENDVQRLISGEALTASAIQDFGAALKSSEEKTNTHNEYVNAQFASAGKDFSELKTGHVELASKIGEVYTGQNAMTAQIKAVEAEIQNTGKVLSQQIEFGNSQIKENDAYARDQFSGMGTQLTALNIGMAEIPAQIKETSRVLSDQIDAETSAIEGKVEAVKTDIENVAEILLNEIEAGNKSNSEGFVRVDSELIELKKSVEENMDALVKIVEDEADKAETNLNKVGASLHDQINLVGKDTQLAIGRVDANISGVDSKVDALGSQIYSYVSSVHGNINQLKDKIDSALTYIQFQHSEAPHRKSIVKAEMKCSVTAYVPGNIAEIVSETDPRIIALGGTGPGVKIRSEKYIADDYDADEKACKVRANISGKLKEAGANADVAAYFNALAASEGAIRTLSPIQTLDDMNKWELVAEEGKRKVYQTKSDNPIKLSVFKCSDAEGYQPEDKVTEYRILLEVKSEGLEYEALNSADDIHVASVFTSDEKFD